MNEIVVLSGKGGTGKTILSAAFSTIEQGCVVADCDVDAANLHLILQPDNYKCEKFLTGYKASINQETCTKCGLCLTKCRFDAIKFVNGQVAVLDTSCDGCKLCSRICPNQSISMVACDESNWFIGDYRNGTIVHARLSPGEENTGKLVNVVREQARKIAGEKGVETIIIDGPPGTGCPVISSLTGTKKAIIVTEPTKSGFHDLKRVVELAENFKIKVYVIINKYDINLKISALISEWCDLKKIEIIGKIPFDKEIVYAMLQCKSIVEWKPLSETSRLINNIYYSIVKNNYHE